MGAAVPALINKDTLKFIRLNTHVSLKYIEEQTGFREDRVLSWERLDSGKMPTINQAKSMAKCFRVPFAGLYMNPSDIPIIHLPNLINFRIMKNPDIDDSAVNLAIIDILKTKDLYLETLDKLKKPSCEFNLHFKDDDPVAWANYFRKELNLTFDKQKSFRSSRQLYLYIRDQVESHGIFISGFTGVKTSVLRGMAIFDEGLPVIGVNDEDRYPAKTFSILHELVHILKRSSSICNDFFDLTSRNSEEIFCNAVAGETLVPQTDFFAVVRNYSIDSIDYDFLKSTSNLFSVSKEVIARRLLDCKIIDQKRYYSFCDELQKRFDAENDRVKQARKDGVVTEYRRNIAREVFDRTSINLGRALIESYGSGLLNKKDVAHYLGVKEKHVEGYITEVAKWY